MSLRWKSLKGLVVVAVLTATRVLDADPSPSATVCVRWSETTDRTEHLSLIPVDAAPDGSRSREKAISEWTRPIGRRNQQCWNSMPEGTYLLMLRAGDPASNAVPVVLAEVVLAPGEARTLVVDLPAPSSESKVVQKGATSAAILRVRRDDGEPASNVRVDVARASALSALKGHFDVSKLVLASAVSNDAGWCRLAGLPADRYVFLIHGENRRRPVLTEPFALVAGEETILEDFSLPRPSMLTVTVDRGGHGDEPIEILSIELSPRGHSHWPLAVPIRVDWSPPQVAIPEVPPGTWKVRAIGRTQGGYALNLGEKTVEVFAGADHFAILDAAILSFDVLVRRDGIPVDGRVTLKPSDRKTGLRSFSADTKDGAFTAFLSGTGEYTVSFEDQTSGTIVRLAKPIAFRDSKRAVEVTIPVGRASGLVVDESGKPVANVEIAAEEARGGHGRAGSRTDGDGRFIVEGLSIGEWRLSAQSAVVGRSPSMPG